MPHPQPYKASSAPPWLAPLLTDSGLASPCSLQTHLKGWMLFKYVAIVLGYASNHCTLQNEWQQRSCVHVIAPLDPPHESLHGLGILQRMRTHCTCQVCASDACLSWCRGKTFECMPHLRTCSGKVRNCPHINRQLLTLKPTQVHKPCTCEQLHRDTATLLECAQPGVPLDTTWRHATQVQVHIMEEK